ncbi:MAG: hypothetical protein ACLP9N_17630, partial [Mycobacterium sp.]
PLRGIYREQPTIIEIIRHTPSSRVPGNQPCTPIGVLLTHAPRQPYENRARRRHDCAGQIFRRFRDPASEGCETQPFAQYCDGRHRAESFCSLVLGVFGSSAA